VIDRLRRPIRPAPAALRRSVPGSQKRAMIRVCAPGFYARYAYVGATMPRMSAPKPGAFSNCHRRSSAAWFCCMR